MVPVAAEKFTGFGQHLRSLHVASHGKHHVARIVATPDIVAHHVGSHAAQGLFRADDRSLVRRALQDMGHGRLEQARHGTVAALFLLGQHHFPLGVEVRLLEERVEGKVAHGGHGFLPLRGGQVGEIGGEVVGGIGIHGAASVLHFLIHARAAGLRALEDHMLEQMAHASLFGLLPGGTGLHEKAHGHQRKAAVFLHQNCEAVFKAIGLYAGHGFGRPAARAEQAEQGHSPGVKFSEETYAHRDSPLSMLEWSNILYSYLWHTPYDCARPSAAYFRDKVFHSAA